MASVTEVSLGLPAALVPPVCQRERWEISAAPPVFLDMRGDTVKSKNNGAGLLSALTSKLTCGLTVVLQVFHRLLW